MNSASLNHVIGHAIGHLPDSIQERKAILKHILALLSKAHPLRVQVDEMLRWLESQEKHQLQLSLDFPNLLKSELSHDGAGDGNGAKNQ